MPRLIVLMFHGVVSGLPEYAMFSGGRTCLLRVSDFERTIEWCTQRYHILRLSDVEEFLSSGSDETGVLLTFDDALASAVDLAAPVLEAYGASATVFVTTQWTGKGRTPAVFLLERDLWTRMPRTVRIESGDRELVRTISSRSDLRSVITAIWSFLLSSRTAPLLLDPLQVTLDGEQWSTERVPESRDFWFPASIDELRKRVDEGTFDIGGHGVTHAPWTMLSAAELRRELVQSRDELENLFGRPVQACSYPHGMVDSRVAGQTGEVFRWAFTTQPGTVEPGSSKTLLPRIHIPSERPFWVGGIVRQSRVAAAARRVASVIGLS